MTKTTASKKGGSSSAVGSDLSQVLDLVKGIAKSQNDLVERVDKIEQDKGEVNFQERGDNSDVEAFNKEFCKDDDIIKVVRRILGNDFKVKFGVRDQVLTIIVPERLTLLQPKKIPKTNKEGELVFDEKTEKQVFETVMPIDERSCKIFHTDTDDEIVNWCEIVKKNIVTNYRESNKPTPTFNV